MIFYEQKEPSLSMWPRGDVIDQLIYQVLSAEVREAEPSSRVWENICRDIAATGVSHPDKCSETWTRSSLGKALAIINTFLCDRSWETRLAERRQLLFWPDHLSLVA